MTTTGPRRDAEPAIQKALDDMSGLSAVQRARIDQITVTDSETIRAELPADLTSASQARTAVREALAAWGMDRLTDDAELMASELVANAAEHGDSTPIGLALRRHAQPSEQPGITCEVTDASAALPQRTSPSLDAERGRGLAIVNALAQSSGVRASQSGKTSWFTLALTDRAHRAAAQIEHEPEAGA
jgi:anti-sigma regulatory factor (Ser/Thr protein kinase)